MAGAAYGPYAGFHDIVSGQIGQQTAPVEDHLVVFDCNAYLDVARLLGPPFSWDVFQDAAVQYANDEVPHPTDSAVDSLRALAVCLSGFFAEPHTLQVWGADHIADTVEYKAKQSSTPHSVTGLYGLGWKEQDAANLVSDLVCGTVDVSGGAWAGNPMAVGNPPLDHEDGKVFGACKHLVNSDALAQVYCVTRDEGFIREHLAGNLGSQVQVLRPWEFLNMVRSARARQKMPKPLGY